MRKIIIAMLCAFSVCALASTEKDAAAQAKAFYISYLTSLASDTGDNFPRAELQKYVAAQTIKRIEEVQKIPEQELLESDYFTYCQDYDPAWIPSLRVGDAEATPDGNEIVQVWLGVENGQKLHLEAFMRQEDAHWKIYRVRDVTNNFEHPIFNDSAIRHIASNNGLRP
ncbi:hypothetical protein NG99_16950 [Erwinia typographi]|uniref:DUF3828 domain-containing protein n=1 Tax=Erwinia typographi TaxID=371042 RepID=A0A0A3Z0G0_9GAMM|nr:YbjP/YqhG family protein [Erwinia typographi]KGT91254.1 hypothetical protein NG99_16950 [Erwinia typographi]